jgi:hypothetical protein
MNTKTRWNIGSLFINLVLLALFVLLGVISFQADSASNVTSATAHIELNH